MRDFSVKGAVKKLQDVTLAELINLSEKDLNKMIAVLPVIVTQAKGELARRYQMGLKNEASDQV